MSLDAQNMDQYYIQTLLEKKAFKVAQEDAQKSLSAHKFIFFPNKGIIE